MKKRTLIALLILGLIATFYYLNKPIRDFDIEAEFIHESQLEIERPEL